MAWRLDNSVCRGEVDNRVRGKVTGRIWLHGRPEPVVLDLEGNCHADLAGCLIEFVNPRPAAGDPLDLHAVQKGHVGDLTASRKVRVFDIPLEEALARRRRGEEAPEHMANCLYVEWFSEYNGRVVIESVQYELRISARAWTLRPEDEILQLEANAHAMHTWMDRLTEAVEISREEPSAEDPEPMDEFQWEKFLRESDQRSEKYRELLQLYKDHPDGDAIIARLMGWDRMAEEMDAKRKDQQLHGPEPAWNSDACVEDVAELEPNPLTEGVDWIRADNGEISHPLCVQTRDLALRIYKELMATGLVDKETGGPAMPFVTEVMILGSKLAGALNSLAYDDDSDGAFVVALLKRALGSFNAAMAHLATLEKEHPDRAELLAGYRPELFGIRESITQLMQKYRDAR